MGGLSIVWYVGLTLVSQNILFDSIAALGLMIAFYYGMTGFACVWYYRRDLTKSLATSCSSASRRWSAGSCCVRSSSGRAIDLGSADAGSTTYFGLGSPLVIGLGFLLLGRGADAASGARWATASSGSAAARSPTRGSLEDDKVGAGAGAGVARRLSGRARGARAPPPAPSGRR